VNVYTCSRASQNSKVKNQKPVAHIAAGFFNSKSKSQNSKADCLGNNRSFLLFAKTELLNFDLLNLLINF